MKESVTTVDLEIRETIRQMLKDWDNATETQRVEARRYYSTSRVKSRNKLSSVLS